MTLAKSGFPPPLNFKVMITVFARRVYGFQRVLKEKMNTMNAAGPRVKPPYRRKASKEPLVHMCWKGHFSHTIRAWRERHVQYSANKMATVKRYFALIKRAP